MAFGLLGVRSHLAFGLAWRPVARRPVAWRPVAPAFRLLGVPSSRRSIAWRPVAGPIFTKGCLVQFFTTRGVVALPENNLIMLGTSIRSFRHLEHQNPSIISEDIGRARSVQQLRRRRRRRRIRSEDRRKTVVLEDRILP